VQLRINSELHPSRLQAAISSSNFNTVKRMLVSAENIALDLTEFVPYDAATLVAAFSQSATQLFRASDEAIQSLLSKDNEIAVVLTPIDHFISLSREFKGYRSRSGLKLVFDQNLYDPKQPTVHNLRTAVTDGLRTFARQVKERGERYSTPARALHLAQFAAVWMRFDSTSVDGTDHFFKQIDQVLKAPSSAGGGAQSDEHANRLFPPGAIRALSLELQNLRAHGILGVGASTVLHKCRALNNGAPIRMTPFEQCITHRDFDGTDINRDILRRV
jgi:hypothetical protein